MKNGARYVVSTHWGTFSLDEGSYRDYLAGHLWICWTPYKKAIQKQELSDYIPPHVTDRAVAIRNLGAKSEQEIKTMFFTECYARLLPYEKAQYWQEVLERCKDSSLHR